MYVHCMNNSINVLIKFSIQYKTAEHQIHSDKYNHSLARTNEICLVREKKNYSKHHSVYATYMLSLSIGSYTRVSFVYFQTCVWTTKGNLS